MIAGHRTLERLNMATNLSERLSSRIFEDLGTFPRISKKTIANGFSPSERSGLGFGLTSDSSRKLSQTPPLSSPS